LCSTSTPPPREGRHRRAAASPPSVSRCSAWPHLLGPPQCDPRLPTGARRPLLLRRHPVIADEPPTTVTDDLRRPSPLLITVGASGSNLRNVRGVSVELMTQMNSAVRTYLLSLNKVLAGGLTAKSVTHMNSTSRARVDF
jgi:hypothetical protein